MMFDPNQFLQTPIFQLTPAARMIIRALELNAITTVQSNLQIEHMATVRERVSKLTTCTGASIATHGEYGLVVIDCIFPNDYVRRTFICVDTEIEDIRIRNLRASGLIPHIKKG